MHQQHVVQESALAAYTSGLSSVWETWSPSIAQARHLLMAGSYGELTDDDRASALRRLQYRAHTAYEFVAGLQPPFSGIDAHETLIATMAHCRDTLGVIAVRAELDELDDHTCDIGMHSVASTRDAFANAQAAPQQSPWQMYGNGIEPSLVHHLHPTPRESRLMGAALWGLVVVCTVLFSVLLYEVLTAPTS
jgi:hypothetical protein